MAFFKLDNKEEAIINLIHENNRLYWAIEGLKHDTRSYLLSKGLNDCDWAYRHEYPNDKHQKWVVQQMEKQIDDLTLKREINMAKLTALLTELHGL